MISPQPNFQVLVGGLFLQIHSARYTGVLNELIIGTTKCTSEGGILFMI